MDDKMKKYYSEILNEIFSNEMQNNNKIIFIGEDIGEYGGAFGVTKDFLKRFGNNRIIDTPISEGSITGISIGLAITGFIPILEIMFMDFTTLILDQIINQAAKFPLMFGEQGNTPLIIRTPMGAGRCYGPSHSQSLQTLFLHIPGIDIYVPFNAENSHYLFKKALTNKYPTLFLEHKLLYNMRFEFEYNNNIKLDEEEFLKADILKEGNFVTLVSYSYTIWESLKAADYVFEKFGIETEVVGLKSLRPLDLQTILNSVKKTGRLIIAEESFANCSPGSEIAFRVNEEIHNSLKAPIKRVALPEKIIPFSKEMEKELLVDFIKIAKAIMFLKKYYDN